MTEIPRPMKHDVVILTRASAPAPDLYLMVHQIVAWVRARYDNPGSLIWTAEDGEYHVQETPDEILQQIREMT